MNAMCQEAVPRHAATAAIGQLRIIIGLAQGIAAWLLLRLVAPTPMSFAALALITAYVPVIAILEVGRMRSMRLARYIASSSVLLGAIAMYDVWRNPTQAFGVEHAVRVWPSFAAGFCSTIAVFMVNQLLEHRERGHHLFEHYAEHFEDSWMRAFQIAVSLVFSLLVWAVLHLGAELFGLIRVGWFRTMIDHDWFRYPASCAAFAAAIHITDVRPALLKGVRNVGLTLLSWLLPLVITVVTGFLIALLFVGVGPLWDTGHAASISLWACAVVILLVNATYKDGDPSALPSAVLRWTGRMAGPVVLLLALVAAYAIGLRVTQHGWTPDRVYSTAVATMALLYGTGYTVASAGRAGWLKTLERVNVAACLVMLTMLALLLSPVVDPSRLSVDSQLARLASGKVPPSQFDYQFLRFDGGRFGSQALERLARDQNPEVRLRATSMQRTDVRQSFPQVHSEPAAAEAALSHAAVYPKGASLPEDFRSADIASITQYQVNCLRGGAVCDIYVVADGTQGVTLIVRPDGDTPGTKPGRPNSGQVFQRDPGGKWVVTGSIDDLECPGVVQALREGKVMPLRPEHDDLLVNGLRLQFMPAVVGRKSCTPLSTQR
jgi:hypothetical protein